MTKDPKDSFSAKLPTRKDSISSSGSMALSSITANAAMP